jgi:hypothetical protein
MLAEIVKRIQGLSVESDLEVEVRTLRVARVAHSGHHLPRVHALAHLLSQLLAMPIPVSDTATKTAALKTR